MGDLIRLSDMSEADLRRAILCDRKASIVRLTDRDELVTECPGDCLAHLAGWHGLYITPLRTRHGWATPARGDWGPGWPDLTLASPSRGRVIFAELKSQAGNVRPEQRIVLDGLRMAGLEAYLWRPSDLDSGVIWHQLHEAPPGARPDRMP